MLKPHCCMLALLFSLAVVVAVDGASLLSTTNTVDVVEYTLTNSSTSYMRFDDKSSMNIWPVSNSNYNNSTLTRQLRIQFQFKTQYPTQLLMLFTSRNTNKTEEEFITIQLISTRIVVQFHTTASFDNFDSSPSETFATNKLGLALNDDTYHDVIMRYDPVSGLLGVELDAGAERDEIVVSRRRQHQDPNTSKFQMVYVGGLPPSQQNRAFPLFRHFVGCIRFDSNTNTNFAVSTPSAAVATKSGGCRSLCTDGSFQCENDGKCINKYSHATCDCSQVPQFEGERCDEAEHSTVSLSGSDYLSHFINNQDSQNSYDISLTFRVQRATLRERPMTLVHISSTAAGVNLEIQATIGVDGLVSIQISDGGGYTFTEQSVNDGNWHRLRVYKTKENEFLLQLDNFEHQLQHSSVIPDTSNVFRLYAQNRRIFFGKAIDVKFENFIGCLRQVYFNGEQILRHSDKNYHNDIPHSSPLLLLNWRPNTRQCLIDQEEATPIAFYRDDSHAKVLNSSDNAAAAAAELVQVEWMMMLAPHQHQHQLTIDRRVATIKFYHTCAARNDYFELVLLERSMNCSTELEWIIFQKGVEIEQNELPYESRRKWTKAKLAFFTDNNSIFNNTVTQPPPEPSLSSCRITNLQVDFGYLHDDVDGVQSSFSGFIKDVKISKSSAADDPVPQPAPVTLSTHNTVQAMPNDYVRACRSDDGINPCSAGSTCSTDGLYLKCQCGGVTDTEAASAAGPLCSHSSVATSCQYLPDNVQQRIKLGNSFAIVNCSSSVVDEDTIHYTTISHNFRPRQIIRRRHAAAVKFDLQYNGLSTRSAAEQRAQLNEIIAQSDKCKQYVEYECTGGGAGASNTNTKLALGVNTFFHSSNGGIISSIGGDSSPGQCECARDGSCPYKNITLGTMLACNCDDETLPSGVRAVDRGWNDAKRTGAIVEAFLFDGSADKVNLIVDDNGRGRRHGTVDGGSEGQQEAARMTIGPLVCWQQDADDDYSVSFLTESASLILSTIPPFANGLSFSFKTTQQTLNGGAVLLFYQPATFASPSLTLSLADNFQAIHVEISSQVNEDLKSIEFRSPTTKFNDGRWHHVKLDFAQRDVRLSVDGIGDEHSLFLISREKFSLAGGSSSSAYLAGIPRSHRRYYADNNNDNFPVGFIGCIKSLRTSTQRVAIGKLVVDNSQGGSRWPEMLRGCQNACSNSGGTSAEPICKNNARCIDTGSGRRSMCQCENEFAHSGARCEHNANDNVVRIASPRAYIASRLLQQQNYFTTNISLSVRTNANNVPLFFAHDEQNNAYRLYIDGNGHVTLNSTGDKVSLSVDSVRVDDGQWHQLHIARTENKLELLVADGSATLNSRQVQSAAVKNVQQSAAGGIVRVYVGNAPNALATTGAGGFVGCLRGLRIASQTINLQNTRFHRNDDGSAEPALVFNSCRAPCDDDNAQHCAFGGKCLNDWSALGDDDTSSNDDADSYFTCDCTLTARTGRRCADAEKSLSFNGSQILRAQLSSKYTNARVKILTLRFAFNAEQQLRANNGAGGGGGEQQKKEISLAAIDANPDDGDWWRLQLTVTPQNFLRLRLLSQQHEVDAAPPQTFETFTELADARQSYALVLTVADDRDNQAARVSLNINGNEETFQFRKISSSSTLAISVGGNDENDDHSANFTGCVSNVLVAVGEGGREIDLLQTTFRHDYNDISVDVQVLGGSSSFEQCAVLPMLPVSLYHHGGAKPKFVSSLLKHDDDHDSDVGDSGQWAQPIYMDQVQGLKLQAENKRAAAAAAIFNSGNAINVQETASSGWWWPVFITLALLALLAALALLAIRRRTRSRQQGQHDFRHDTNKKNIKNFYYTNTNGSGGASKNGHQQSPETQRLVRTTTTETSTPATTNRVVVVGGDDPAAQPLNRVSPEDDGFFEEENINITVRNNKFHNRPLPSPPTTNTKPKTSTTSKSVSMVQIVASSNGDANAVQNSLVPRFKLWPAMASSSSSTNNKISQNVVIDTESGANDTTVAAQQQKATCYNLALQAKAFIFRKQQQQPAAAAEPSITIRPNSNSNSGGGTFSPRITLYIDDDFNIDDHQHQHQKEIIESESPTTLSSSSSNKNTSSSNDGSSASPTISSTAQATTQAASSATPPTSPGGRQIDNANINAKNNSASSSSDADNSSTSISLSDYSAAAILASTDKIVPFIDNNNNDNVNGITPVISTGRHQQRTRLSAKSNRDSWFTATNDDSNDASDENVVIENGKKPQTASSASSASSAAAAAGSDYGSIFASDEPGDDHYQSNGKKVGTKTAATTITTTMSTSPSSPSSTPPPLQSAASSVIPIVSNRQI